MSALNFLSDMVYSLYNYIFSLFLVCKNIFSTRNYFFATLSQNYILLSLYFSFTSDKKINKLKLN